MYYKAEKKILLIAIFSGIIITIIFTAISKGYSQTIQKGIADEIIRLHILANSDTEYDQKLKLEVKKNIIKMLETDLSKSKSKDETRLLLIKNMEKIEKKATETILKNGYNYDVNVELKLQDFPTKVYGDITIPAGEYEALTIEIGEAKGHNWWCVMFPPLCFVEPYDKVVPKEDKKLLEDVLTEDEYEIVSKSDENFYVKVKFKLVEMWQNSKIKDK